MVARRLTRLWPLAALVAVAAVVLVIEGTGSWRRLDAGLRSLDFDAERALLLEAWLAGAVVAFAGALITGRPWASSAFAVGFVGVTYVLALGTRLAQQVPTLFGIRERVAAGAIQHNQLVALAVAFLVALVAAALADLIGREIRQHLRDQRSRTRVVRSGALAGALILTVLLATGVDPLLRVGPEAGVYSPGAVAGRPVSATGSPTPMPVAPATGEVRHVTYPSAAMAENRHFIIYLPPSYSLRSAAHRHYPTLYLLHGDPSGPVEWLNYGTPALFDAGIATGNLPETIVVLPDGNGHVTPATQWANRRDGRDRIDDALLELVGFVDQHYRTNVDRQYRVIGGLSSGAYGAVNIAARHPETFGVAMGFSGYYIARGPVFGTDAAYRDQNSPTVMLQRSPAARTVHYVLTVGAADGYRANTEQFLRELQQLGVTTDFTLIQGGHGGRVYWQGLLFGLGVIKSQLAAGSVEPSVGR